MESFQTPFIGCLRTGALQEQDEPAPLELLGALQRNPDAETEQDPITTPPTLCPRPKHQPPNPPRPQPWLCTQTHHSKALLQFVTVLLGVTFWISLWQSDSLLFQIRLLIPVYEVLFHLIWVSGLSIATASCHFSSFMRGSSEGQVHHHNLWFFRDHERMWLSRLRNGLWSYQSTLRDRLL